jgi:hypothetical protein
MDRTEMVERVLDRIANSDAAAQWSAPLSGTTTRCIVIDDLLPEEVGVQIFEAFPKDAEGFRTLKSFREFKRQTFDLSNLPPVLSDITLALQDPRVVEAVGEVCDIRGLDGDPTLYAGGLSMMFRGQFLNPHIDNSHEATRTRYRRINSLYYVTPNWKIENGGNLELWNHDVSKQQTVVSKFNRLVFMETNRNSWHSVSPVVADEGRCCVSNYYFSAESPDGESYYHVTSYNGRPEQRALRALSKADNALRQLARAKLNLSRSSDAGGTAAAKPS